MLKRLDRIEAQALTSLESINNPAALQAWKVKYLGRSAELAEVLQDLPKASKEERPQIGRRANEVKNALVAAYEEQANTLHKKALAQSLVQEHLDVTLPGRPRLHGRLHPATQTLRQIFRIWAEMGFQIYHSREVETDEYNFGLLNMPAYHPARDMWDTFHTTRSGIVLRTHTSPGQIHVMRERAPEPVRVILPGMCYRYEQITARSEIQFNQIEGLAIGHNITFADLKGTLTAFVSRFFGQNTATRFRASHFPFTEPSAEMDVECFICGGEGCSVCKDTGWLEILGCGMMHPLVLQNGGYDPEEFSGFAFGMGPERMTMLKRQIHDIRYFWGNDLRFLEQF
jgi:phenylalanyl-tRNA synthetase alpha chain